MSEPTTYKEAKKETLAKWSRVLLLVERAEATANIYCSFCKLPESTCPTCPAGTLCLGETHLNSLQGLRETQEELRKLVRHIRTIKLPKEERCTKKT